MFRAISASPTHATIDISALSHNLRRIRSRVGPDCGIVGIVKANAYGHGAIDICKALLQMGVTMFGVATVAEGLELRDAGVACDILVLGPTVPRELNDLVRHRLTPLVYDETMLLALNERLDDQAAPCPVHIEVDTGMGRLGLSPDRVLALTQSTAFGHRLRVGGLMTHFADADNPDPTYSLHQIDRFTKVLHAVRTLGTTVPMVHMANTAGIAHYPQAHFDAVRPGLGLYGYVSRDTAESLGLQPVLSWHTHIVQIRAMQIGDRVSYNGTFTATRASRIAVLPMGYADGYSRMHSNRAQVLVHGMRVPVVGRVCMDMTMIDVTDVPQAQPGDEVTLIGTQGDQTITAADLAEWQGTIPYEVLCAIGPRVRRIYTGRTT
ncbi:MAG: alanine racemase [Nitrospiraceae bacterium]